MKKFSILLISLLLAVVAAGCSGSTSASPNAAAGDAGPLKVGRADYAPHGTKSFAVVVVALSGDTIVAASLDEYQFLSTDVATGVPNADAVADGDFASNFKDPNVVLASKRANTEYYSKHMKEAAGSTVTIHENFDAVEAYVTGKSVAELEDILAKKNAEQMMDAVSGATLRDTKGYVQAFVAAAKAAK